MHCEHSLVRTTSGIVVCTECGWEAGGRRQHWRPRRRRRRAPVLAALIVILLLAAAAAALLAAAQQEGAADAGLSPELAGDYVAGIAARAGGLALEAARDLRMLAHTSLPLPDGPRIGAAEAASLIHNMTNEERVRAGLLPLARDARLDGIARQHADDMAARGYFSHVAPEGATPSDRAAASGYACLKRDGVYVRSGIAENIHMSYTHVVYTRGLAAGAVGGWMDSPGHRENILGAGYDRLGVGIAISDGGTAYAVQNFCRPRRPGTRIPAHGQGRAPARRRD